MKSSSTWPVFLFFFLKKQYRHLHNIVGDDDLCLNWEVKSSSNIECIFQFFFQNFLFSLFFIFFFQIFRFSLFFFFFKYFRFHYFFFQIYQFSLFFLLFSKFIIFLLLFRFSSFFLLLYHFYYVIFII